MKIFRIIAVIAIAAMLFVAFAACRRDDDGDPPATVGDGEFVMPTTPVSMSFWWWGSDSRAAAVEEAINIFTDRYSNVTIEPQPATGAFGDITEAMITRVAAGTTADVNQVNFNWVHLFGRGNNVFADLRDVDHIIDFDQFSQSDIDSMTLGCGAVAGLPHGMNARMLITNTAFLREFGLDAMPTDFEEFVALAERVSANNVEIDDGNNRYLHVPFSNLDIDHFILTLFYSMTRRDNVVDGQWNFTVDEVERVLEMLVRLEAAGGQPTFYNHDPINNEQNQVWTSGRGASSFQWINVPQNQASVVGEGAYMDDMVLFPFPQPGGDTVAVARASLAHAISRNPSNFGVAAYFLNFFYTDPAAIRAVGTELGVPGGRDAFAIMVDDGRLHPLQQQGIDLLNSLPVGFMGVYWEDATLRNPRYAIYDELRTGRITVREAAERLVREQQEALDIIYR